MNFKIKNIEITIEKWWMVISHKDGRFIQPFNWIDDPKFRSWGYQYTWYDGPYHYFGFWFFNIGWSL